MSPNARVQKLRRCADTALVEYEWIFERDGQKVIVQRWRRPDRIWELTLIWTTGEIETEGYLDVAALVDEHVKLERELVRAGWALVEFRPERRQYDRRQQTKLRSAIDRRRLGRPGSLHKSLAERISSFRPNERQ